MKNKLKKKYNSKAGFTLLELLVVVAIIAAIAGTATMAFKDTDARAAAAAHVGMMDELNKGVRVFRVLNAKTLPTRMDSLLWEDSTTPAPVEFDIEVGGDAIAATLTAEISEMIFESGCEELMYLSVTTVPTDGDFTDVADEDNDSLKAAIQDRGNMVVAGNIFLPAAANGFGVAVAVTNNPSVVLWNGDNERISGQSDDNSVYMLTGLGPASDLFDPNKLAGMTTVPIYRHVGPKTYNRFIAVWKIGENGVTAHTIDGDFKINDNGFELITILDGALDTKEEELGEWDGTRAT